MRELAAVRFEETRSRFYAHLYEVERPDELEDILKFHRREYKKAVHHCHAIRVEVAGRMVESSKDDGEVGHPGKVLMELLRSNDLRSHALVVSRVFGGVKLGVGGVSRAFREAGTIALDEAINCSDD
ncbi:MAG: YigZ family protein [Candidatus Thermoplasmatota archaeon]|jgi:putative IMPACT (imprinted ancient) family translation regulator|nr:YigZ family protein [Candidatus Thermoplasmatota archaeon]